MLSGPDVNYLRSHVSSRAVRLLRDPGDTDTRLNNLGGMTHDYQ